MAENKKKTTAKTSTASAKQGADKAKKAAGEVFGKLKKQFDAKKVDAWQEKWLAVPANRKKYEKISDAPEVAGEELMAMANDIINFAQGEEGGNSHLFKKVKTGLGGFFKNPAKFMQDQAAKGKKMANKAKDTASKAAKSTKKAAKKK